MKNDRQKVGILFNFSSQWMGGVIYVINIVNTLNFLEDDKKPEIILFYNPELKKFLNEFTYPYLTFRECHFPSILKGNLISLIKRRNVFIDKLLKDFKINSLFPIHDFPVRTRTQTKLIAWWADLQEKYYPDFFSPLQRLGRTIRTRLILRNSDHLVLSSNEVLNDFRKFYMLRDKLEIHVFHFVSVIESEAKQSIVEIREKYRLPKSYFLVSNQFHKHKNHRVLLLALARLKAKGIIKYVAFTGKLPSAQNSDYLTELHAIINENNLHDQVIMLGLIPRGEQLSIMKHCQAVIQPSLFEGWSTVIEDAKSLQIPVIASNLTVNIEQLGDRGVYFDPLNSEELASIMDCYPERNSKILFYDDYYLRIKEAALQLFAILG